MLISFKNLLLNILLPQGFCQALVTNKYLTYFAIVSLICDNQLSVLCNVPESILYVFFLFFFSFLFYIMEMLSLCWQHFWRRMLHEFDQRHHQRFAWTKPCDRPTCRRSALNLPGTHSREPFQRVIETKKIIQTFVVACLVEK